MVNEFEGYYLIEEVEIEDKITIKSRSLCDLEQERTIVVDKDKIKESIYKGLVIKVDEENDTYELFDSMGYTEYKDILAASVNLPKEHLIQLFKTLEKVTANIFGVFVWAEDYFVSDVLDCNYGFSVVKHIPRSYIDFMNSKELSDYYKKNIRKRITDPDILKLIDGDILLAELDKDEWRKIYDSLVEYKTTIEHYDDNFNNKLLIYAMNIDSVGAKEFLNSEDLNDIVIRRIVVTSGLNPRPEYYSGRGVKENDLNVSILVEIFNKLRSISVEKSDAMAEMVQKIEILGATEFLTNLYRLANNNYDIEKMELDDKGYSFGQAKGNSLFAIGLATIASSIGRNRDVEKYATTSMVKEFNHRVDYIKDSMKKQEQRKKLEQKKNG